MRGLCVQWVRGRSRSLAFEVYEDATTDLYIVVAPEERGRGIAARLLSVLDERPELGEVQRFRSAVHLDNQSARRVLAKAGFTVPPDLNQYGELQVERLRVARPAVPAPAPD